LAWQMRITLEFVAGIIMSVCTLIPFNNYLGHEFRTMFSTDFLTFLSIVISIAVVILFEKIRAKRKAAAISYLSYDKKTKTLTVRDRKPENAHVIKVAEMVDYNLTYHPSEIVYTGVTVGGVHTGGFCDIGNYHTIDGTSTKKYHLIYRGADVTSEDYCPIEVIKLHSSLVNAAKKTADINQYLSPDGTLTLSNNVKSKYAQQIEAATKQGNVDLAIKLAKADYFNQQLSKEQCTAIKDWICS